MEGPLGIIFFRDGSSRDSEGDGDDDHGDDKPYNMSRVEEIETTDPVDLWWVRIVVRTIDLDMMIEELQQPGTARARQRQAVQ